MASVGGAIGLTNQFQFKETYEKLKEAEQKERLLKPRERVDKLDAQEKDVTEIMTHFNAIKIAASDLTDNKNLGQKQLKTEGESAKATVSKGVAAMDFSVDVVSLAAKDTFQTEAIDSEESPLFSKLNKAMEEHKHNGKMYDKGLFKVRVGEESFEIAVEKSTSLNQLAQKLRQAKNDNGKELKNFMNVKLIDTGKDGFRLMLSAAKSGVENALHFEAAGDNDAQKAISRATLDILGFGAEQAEADARELVDKSKELSDKSLELIGAEKFDAKGFKESLEGEELELKTKSGKSFKIDKETDILGLTGEKLEAFYEHSLRAEVAEYVTNLPEKERVEITIKSLSNYEQLKADIAEQEKLLEQGQPVDEALSELRSQLADMEKAADPNDRAPNFEKVKIESREQFDELLKDGKITDAAWSKLKDAFYEHKAQKWLEHMAASNLSDEVKLAGEKEPIALGSDIKDWKAAGKHKKSAELKEAIIARFAEQHKAAFMNQASVRAAEKKLDEAKEQADKNHIQRAADAVFKYDGISITRSENEVKDIILGVTLSFIKTGETQFSLKPDPDEMLKQIDSFVSAYNSLMNNINAATDFDKDAHQAKGTLLGITEVQQARSGLTRLLDKRDGLMSLSTLGLELNRDGILKFDKKVFKTQYDANSEAIDKFLLGGTDYEKFKFTSERISAMPVIASGDLVINDKHIALDSDFIDRLNSSQKSKQPSMEEYREALLAAINDADIEGITASINDEGRLVLESDGEHEIAISGLEEKLLQIGLKETTLEVKSKPQKGIFDDIKEHIKGLTDEKEGTLTKLGKNLKEQSKSVQKDMDKIKEDIDKRFDTLRDRLSRYDVILNKLDNQSRLIDGMMKAAFAEKK